MGVEKNPLPELENGDVQDDASKHDQNEKENGAEKDRGTYFDDAIVLCGYGKFHIYLFIAAVFGQIATTIVSSNSAYVLANAECDLHMSLVDKGTLNAIPFAGMISSGLVTGFLSDALGRKVFLVWGYFAMAFCVLVQATSQTFPVLLAMKFLEGFCFTGPFTVAITYMGEMHDKKTRSKILLFVFCSIGICHTVLPLIAWLVMPYDWALVVIEEKFVLRSWHLFLLVNSLWSIVAFTVFSFLPESPKFLLAHSKHDEALAILKKMYAINSGKPAHTYPVEKVYLNISYEASSSVLDSLKDGFKNIRPLFSKRYIFTLLHVCVMQFCIMSSFNTFRLWYPQLATIFENYGRSHGESGPVCVMLNEYLDQKAQALNLTEVVECVTVRSGSETYINSTILGAASIIPYVAAGFLINKLGKKVLIFITMGSCGVLAATLFLAVNSTMIVVYFAIFVPMAQISVSLMLTITVDAFPTGFRALTLSALMMVGRCGALLGNILFPYFLEMGCLIPFILVSSLSFVAAFLGLIIPKSSL